MPMTEIQLQDFQGKIYDLAELYSVENQIPFPEVMVSLLTIALVAAKQGLQEKFTTFIAEQIASVDKAYADFQADIKQKEVTKDTAAESPAPVPTMDFEEIKKFCNIE
jgi:hypothetical protein